MIMGISNNNRENRQASRTQSRWWRDALLALLLLTVLVVVYWPALHGDFLWDDDAHITKNTTLRTASGLWSIWTKPGIALHYYPLTFTGFWVGYHLWGLNPLGFHLLTLFFHGLTSVLLWQVLKPLQVRGAGVAGAIFALHPVNVMSVAWMTELKNTLSGTMALATAWAYVRFAGLGIYQETAACDLKEGVPEVDWRFGFLSLLLFQLAMFAKTAVSFLPVSLFLLLWWQGNPVRWRDVWPFLAMLGIVVLEGRITFSVERLYGATGKEFEMGLLERILISGRSFWFYLGKLLFPHRLMFVYERWQVDARVWWQYLYPAATVGLLVGLWLMRKGIGKGLFAALMHFYVSTSLLILMLVLFFTRYSWVSDHWQYFGCMSVIATAAVGITVGLDRIGKPFMNACLVLLLLLVLSVLTWLQCGMYADVVTFWRTVIAKNPNCWLAHNNLGVLLREAGSVQDAIQHYEAALQSKPDYAEAHYNLANAFLQLGRMQDAIGHYERALQIDPNYVGAHSNLAFALLRTGKVQDAITHLEQAVQINPGSAEAHYNLALAQAEQGRLEEAKSHFEIALKLNPGYAEAHYMFALLLAKRGQNDDAISHMQRALELEPGSERFRRA